MCRCHLSTIITFVTLLQCTSSFTNPSFHLTRKQTVPAALSSSSHTKLNASGNSVSPPSGQKLSTLPKGISPFEKSVSKSLDIQADFRARAKVAVEAAAADGVRLLEIEFPPLIGGDQSKSQFDDFDNIQELDKNKDWTMLFAPTFLGQKEYANGKTWLVFPDLKECEIAKKEWVGARYREATFTTIEAATSFLGQGSYDAPWASSLVSGLSKAMGGDKGDAGFLGDTSVLDELVDGKNSPPAIQFVIQPGNGGPVEDWINCEKMHLGSPESVMVIINGALDKVRAGYYPGVFFPKLAATVDRFFKNFESIFYLKPVSDKGVYGWLFRVYPEPWQLVLQTTTTKNNQIYVEDIVVNVSDVRPTYAEAVNLLVKANSKL
mmetsp:Transcript_21590/g.26726  ORF Transcript_21590/g.26726 Transcript_21590/m.26726 type:complete len:378 (+) Transcript_21590:160-1293(+)|eukprot:CAMPEP_0172509334 /NCGR_PEP_ID=MMETSP1066-20121228/219458_1 /TAXON_ID=671091 /ORGANISM="Coscinodiscus wailesii, Strain CCMP2513" /LENGTH=377 /DNA_ID=CAMNT_0013287757 /DNA_START=159 /DNA_END=1292 /DNA_ORIENTATION=+